MSDERKVKIDFGAELVILVAYIFLLFWLQSGWYRLDCALGISRACELIAAEKEYQTPVTSNEASKP